MLAAPFFPLKAGEQLDLRVGRARDDLNRRIRRRIRKLRHIFARFASDSDRSGSIIVNRQGDKPA